MADGSVVAYRDADPSHIRQARFDFIYNHTPLAFQITLSDTSTFAVDLVDGSFFVGDERYTPDPVPNAALRLIYYKHMEWGCGGQPEMAYVVLGWQTTLDGKNVKYGMKIWPNDKRWEMTNDI